MLTIRTAEPSDASTIVEFQIRMAHESEDLDLDRDTVTQGVNAVFEDPLKGEYLLAEEHGKPVGVLLCLKEWSDWRNGTVLWIHSLYVIPPARRRGVFTTLYRHLKQRVEKSPALKGLRLYVEKGNSAARKAYRGLGMTDEHYRLYEWLKPH